MSNGASVIDSRSTGITEVISEPLTDKEKQTIVRLLSDPSLFPREFKEWITTHSSDTVDIAKTQVHGLVNNAGQVVIGSANMGVLGATLCGVCVPYAASLAPEGWLLCDGREILRTDYPTLFNLIGTVWGAPSDTTKFKLPDLRGRVPVGTDGNFPFAGNEGLAAGARGHRHQFSAETDINSRGTNYAEGVGGHQHGVNSGSGGGYTDYAGAHGHNVFVDVWGHLSLSNPSAYAGTGWAGLNWIIGSGKLP